jgi:hypothetical protein
VSQPAIPGLDPAIQECAKLTLNVKGDPIDPL